MDIWILTTLCLLNSKMAKSSDLVDEALTKFCYDGGKGDLVIPDGATER